MIAHVAKLGPHLWLRKRAGLRLAETRPEWMVAKGRSPSDSQDPGPKAAYRRFGVYCPSPGGQAHSPTSLGSLGTPAGLELTISGH